MVGRWLLAATLALGSAAGAAAPAPVQVMVLGTYHFGNPGRDNHNVVAEDVRAPKRQAELARLADALAAWRPTRIAVEDEGVGPDLSVPGYTRFAMADLATARNERDQIGYRLARKLGLPTVQGIDVEFDFPYEAVAGWAAAHGEKPALDAMNADVAAMVGAFTARQATASIPALLAEFNAPGHMNGRIDSYYGFLRFGDATAQPGAELNARWYERNARIFARLMSVAKPGDRILVIYGAGHLYWLRHFAASVPGFQSVDVMPYLRKAAR